MTKPVVLVTGANRGVGYGLVRAFASSGWDVVVTARQASSAEQVADELGGGTVGVACDVTVPGSVEAAVASALSSFGRLDAFVHNGVSTRSSEVLDLATAGLDVWEDHASVSIRGAWRCARAAYEPLRASGRGALLLMTSPAGIAGSPNNAFYGAVKGAQRAFVRSLAREWGPLRIRVNALAPLAMTPALENAMREDPTMEARLTRNVALRRFGDPELDIGPPAVFLCGEAARYVTGQNLIVSGGRLTSA